ncbi:MAG: hypothetical protein P8105_04410, partial [Dehalococcoidia bacterium]
MKKLSVLISILVITLILATMFISCKTTTGPTQPTQPTKPSEPAKETKLLRLAVPYPAGDMMCVHFDEFIAQFNEAAAGEYAMKLYPSETLVKVPESFDAVRTGAVEMTSVASNIFAGIDPRLGAAGLPMLVNNEPANAALCIELAPLYNDLYSGGLTYIVADAVPIFV